MAGGETEAQGQTVCAKWRQSTRLRAGGLCRIPTYPGQVSKAHGALRARIWSGRVETCSRRCWQDAGNPEIGSSFQQPRTTPSSPPWEERPRPSPWPRPSPRPESRPPHAPFLSAFMASPDNSLGVLFLIPSAGVQFFLTVLWPVLWSAVNVSVALTPPPL